MCIITIRILFLAKWYLQKKNRAYRQSSFREFSLNQVCIKKLLTLNESLAHQVVVHCLGNNFGDVIAIKLNERVSLAFSGLQAESYIPKWSVSYFYYSKKWTNNITFPFFKGEVSGHWPGGVNNNLQMITFLKILSEHGFYHAVTGEQVISYMHQLTVGSGIWPQTSVTSELTFSLSRERRANLKYSSEFYLFTPGQPESQDFAKLFKISFELRFKQTLWQMPHIYHSGA